MLLRIGLAMFTLQFLRRARDAIIPLCGDNQHRVS
jgi:hypothetical protein